MNENDKENLLSLLKESVVEITFEKKNGELRDMKCTLNSDLIPQKTEKTETRQRKRSPESMAVYDVEKQSWRSFRWDSLKDYPRA